ncbi:MAG: hypothetical protein SH868_14810 [Bythopirellula sp.]|nr:hypothetical protein [Bythopirellula sp.]
MTEIQLDSVTEVKFSAVTSRVPVRGSNGQVLGHYVPEEEYIRMLYASFKCDLSEEELARRAAEPGVYTLEDIWKQLGVK